MEKQIGLDELISDINRSKSAELSVYFCTGVGIAAREQKFEELSVSKNDEGDIILGIDMDVKAIGNQHEIYKTEDAEETAKTSYEIREEGLLLLTLNLYK